MAQDRKKTGDEYHRPVLAEEVAKLLAPVLPGVVVDATFGGGGHSKKLLDEFGEDVQIIGIDRDPEALVNAGQLGILAIEGNFSDLAGLVSPHIQDAPAGVLFDFGVSSHQLDQARRGFSYRLEGPLDMRMGPDAELTAEVIVNQWSESELARIIRDYGEESLSKRISRAIVRSRPIESTGQLSTVIAQAMPAARRGGGGTPPPPFQAIRIAVNSELEAVRAGLDQAIEVVRQGGRVIAISYHSLEDRIVKQRFARGAVGCVCPPDLPVCGCGKTSELRLLTRKPLRASEDEIAENKRARSAVCRAAERLAA